jgi:hypothetical protein
MREIGIVKQVQVQCSSLKRVTNETQIYDPAPLLVVNGLLVSSKGVIGLKSDGEKIVDVHNADHPQSKKREENGVSVGFTSHYSEMRAKYGSHLIDGIAGENILVESDKIVRLADLGKQLLFQNSVTGVLVSLAQLCVDAPCEPFSRFALQQSPPVPVATMKATLQFLHNGIRGFYATASDGVIQAGDKVLASDD